MEWNSPYLGLLVHRSMDLHWDITADIADCMNESKVTGVP